MKALSASSLSTGPILSPPLSTCRHFTMNSQQFSTIKRILSDSQQSKSFEGDFNLHIGKPGDQHHPLLVSGELVKERTMRDPQVLQGGELPQLVHLDPVLDLGGGDVEGVEAGGQLGKSFGGRQL